MIDSEAGHHPVLGDVSLSAASDEILKKKSAAAKEALKKKNEMLPPTYFAAYVVPKAMSPFSAEYAALANRVVGHVDTGATPWSVVSESFVSQNRLLTSPSSVVLGLGDKSAPPVKSDQITDFNLRVTIGDRARIVHLKAVVWSLSAF